jgi:predicted regulator of Ras-like GTPase activity (Roadblock/LC7/MglB family)
MTIPFAGLFQKLKAGFRPAPEPSAAETMRPLPLEKKSGDEKLSKTVLPNATRTIAPLDPFDIASGALTRAPIATGSRPSAPPSRSAGLPPAVAVALEPKIERTISLQLSEVIASVPADYLKPAGAIDPNRRVLLKAAEIEKGMAIGKPAISLVALYEQVPEIFVRSVPPAEVMHVPLPMDKVLEQITNVRVRNDQEQEQVVPQVDTPILQATLEDTQKFGTSMAPIQTSEHPPVIVEPATAKSLAHAEPETAVRETAAPSAPRTRAPIPLSIPVSAQAEPPPAKAPEQPAKPTRIPFELPPNGTDVPASERVPASSGPSVPIRLSQPGGPGPGKMRRPPDALRPKLTLVPGVEPHGAAEDEDEFAAPPAVQAKAHEPKVSLRLQPILEHVPPFQLSGSPSSVPADAEIVFPLSLIQPQLAVGRVSIPPKVFQAAMPRQLRELLIIDPSETPIQLPLHEVLKKIPTQALRMRTDQEEPESGETFETPFSIKAKEDAERFQVRDTPVPKPTEAEVATEGDAETTGPEGERKDVAGPTDVGAEILKLSSADEAASAVKSEVDASKDATRAMDGGDQAEAATELDAKQVVARATKLPGVAGCLITFADGLSVAGNLPDELAVGGLCAMAPSLLQRIEKHMLDTKLGAMNALTLRGENSALSFFRHGSICLAALHQNNEQLGAETHSQLFALTRNLSRTFAQPESTHVHH